MACSGTILRCIDHCDGLQVTRSKIGKARMQECLRDVQGVPVLIVTGAKDRCAALVTMKAVCSSDCSVLLLGELPCQTPSTGVTVSYTCRISTPQHVAVISNKLLQECTCMMLPGVGHLSNEEAPRALNACLATFCKHAFASMDEDPEQHAC